VIYLHGGFQPHSEATTDLSIFTICMMLASHGLRVISPEVGGTLWGNTDDSRVGTTGSRTLITEAFVYLVSTMGADPFGKVAIIGTSMGGMNGLSWISANLSSTLCFVGIAPVSNGQEVYDEGFATIEFVPYSMDHAYLTTTWPTARSTHDPRSLVDAGAFTGLNYLAFYGTGTTVPNPVTGAQDGDGIITSSSVTHMASTIGATATAIALPGTSHFTTLVPTVPAGRILSYITSLYAATSGRTVLAIP